MPTPYDVICISSIDWDFMWQSHQEIMSRLAARGNRVLFIENTGVRAPTLRDLPRIRHRWRNWRRGVYGIRQERENLFVFSPLVIPFPHSRVAAWINRQLVLFVIRRWTRAMGFTQPIIWTYLPTRLTLDLVSHIEHRLLVYYCAAFFSATPSAAARKIQSCEAALLRRADLVLAISQALAEHCRQTASQVHFVPLGVNLDVFDRLKVFPRPPELAHVPRPVIGYVGGIHQWLDLSLVRELALGRPDYSFVLVGPIQTNTEPLRGLTNVFFVGQRPHHELPGFIQAFDVGIIPYRVTEYTRHVYPSKLNEYLAMGKPVISTALPEIHAFNQRFGSVVSVAHNASEFREALHQTVHDENGERTTERYRAAHANDWEILTQRITALIHTAIQEKAVQREQQWQQALITLARASLRRAVRALWPALVGYALLFHTPVVWWVAQPLSLKDMPVRADAIVVFAGGVGESGQAGQGYQERVEHAVTLYRQGLAPLLLFSSGYRYTFKEAEVMKVLAVSLGVPPEAVLPEELAANTRENVRLSAALLRTKGCDSALVVSSPYHMRRVSLVWRKEAPDIAVTWTPIPYSHFFGNHSQVKLRHIQAIVHEYLGILYYWWKGWI